MTTTNRMVFDAVRWSVKKVFCSKFPDIPEKSQGGKIANSDVIAKCYSVQANATRSASQRNITFNRNH